LLETPETAVEAVTAEVVVRVEVDAALVVAVVAVVLAMRTTVARRDVDEEVERMEEVEVVGAAARVEVVGEEVLTVVCM
jgi:hypothetical protein